MTLLDVVDFHLKDNLALVDVLSPKESDALLNQFVSAWRDNELTKGLTVPQEGSAYQVVKVNALAGQNMEIEGAKNQLLINVGHYYVMPANRISLIGGITTNMPQAFVNTQDLLAELEVKEQEQ